MPAFNIRTMHVSDIEEGMYLSTTEGWNQTAKDWKFLIEYPYSACLAGETNNKLIATTTAINYSNSVAWIGMVLVNKEYRGMGVSKLLLSSLLKKMNSVSSIKLDATDAGREVYKKLGFKDEYFITRMVCPSVGVLPKNDETITTIPIRLKDITTITAFDEKIFGANRATLIEYLIKEYPHKAWMIKRNNDIAGFALGRDGNRYHHIGPVVASTNEDAKDLISAALKNLTGKAAVLDVLNDKEELINWLSSVGFFKQRHFIRMYKKSNNFRGAVDKYHLICGPEFG